MELRLTSMGSTLAVGICFGIASLTSLPTDVFLTPITTWTPQSSRTHEVSVLMLVVEAPKIAPWNSHNKDIIHSCVSDRVLPLSSSWNRHIASNACHIFEKNIAQFADEERNRDNRKRMRSDDGGAVRALINFPFQSFIISRDLRK
ncbi:unnamed protein product [Lactuca virosa]|uniref:Secreted protein n=1 Tax=Lactuca virosa TaxID=75947 RepID=A0AAU9M7C6_9ASTR|nr:unnamed protein product [Lactuca virosa]